MISIEPLFIVNMLVGVTLACCVAVVAFGRDRDLLVWAAGFGLYGLGFAMFGLRGQIPDMASVIGGNGSLALMFTMFSEGICRLYHSRVSRWLIWGPPLLAPIGFALLLSNFEARVIFGTLLMSYHSLMVIFLVTSGLLSSCGRGRWIIFAAIAISSAMFLLRGLLMAFGVESGLRILIPGMAQTIFFSIGMVCLIMFAIGLLVTYTERAEAALLQLAHHDPLTQLGNRRVLEERLDIALAESRANGLYGALIMLDMDYFKEMNDTHGHALGDQLLMELAYRLRDSVADDDTVVRLGGDEFVVLIGKLGTDIEGARSHANDIAHRLLEKLKAPYLLQLRNADSDGDNRISCNLTVSIGIALFNSKGQDATHEGVLMSADAAMYRAKQAGRNCIRF